MTVQKWHDRSIHIIFEGRSLTIMKVDQVQRQRDKEIHKDVSDTVYKPTMHHPWRIHPLAKASTPENDCFINGSRAVASEGECALRDFSVSENVIIKVDQKPFP